MTFDGMGVNFDCCIVVVGQKQVWMVAFFLGNGGDFVEEFHPLNKILPETEQQTNVNTTS
jgi:hypothetical protein